MRITHKTQTPRCQQPCWHLEYSDYARRRRQWIIIILQNAGKPEALLGRVMLKSMNVGHQPVLADFRLGIKRHHGVADERRGEVRHGGGAFLQAGIEPALDDADEPEDQE